MFECPECGEKFDSDRSVKIHYAHSHDGNMPNNNCSNCNKDFYHPSRNDRVYCDECFEGNKGPREKPKDISLPDNLNWRELTPYQRYYYENRDSEIDRRSENNHRNKLKKFVQRIKREVSCSKCDEGRAVCLVFHHTKKNKKDNISNMVSRGVSMERLQSEIKKCEVLCSNCHRVKHRKI